MFNCQISDGPELANPNAYHTGQEDWTPSGSSDLCELRLSVPDRDPLLNCEATIADG